MSHDFRSHNLLNRAVALGMVKRPERCEACSGTGKAGKLASIEAHHDDYNLPLVVRWLCKSCHRRWHGRNEPIAPRADLDFRPFEAQLRAYARANGLDYDEATELLASLDEGPAILDEDFPL